MGEVKVSVIVYVKDTVNYIGQCISSVMAQTMRELEILVIDGGSTDGTLDIIEGLMKGDSRIRLFHGTASVGAQFNLGLREAKGEYIGVCEADDFILPTMYERQYEVAKKYQLDAVRAGYYRACTLQGREYRFPVASWGKEDMAEKVIDSSQGTYFLEQGINGFWSGIYRKQFLMDHGIWMNETKGAAYQDVTFSFLIQMWAERIWFMKEGFYCYRIDNPGASVNSLQGVELLKKEYGGLKKRLKEDKEWDKYKELFFSWELASYQWFLRDLPRDARQRNVEGVYMLLKEEVGVEGYDCAAVMENVRNLASKLLQSKETFVETILEGVNEKDKFLNYMESRFQRDLKLVLFGAGHMGTIMAKFLELCRKEVVLADNDRFLQKCGVRGKKVYSPGEAAEAFPDAGYVIASSFHGHKMKNQLIGLGIPEERIVICGDEEFLLRKIFTKAFEKKIISLGNSYGK